MIKGNTRNMSNKPIVQLIHNDPAWLDTGQGYLWDDSVALWEDIDAEWGGGESTVNINSGKIGFGTNNLKQPTIDKVKSIKPTIA